MMNAGGHRVSPAEVELLPPTPRWAAAEVAVHGHVDMVALAYKGVPSLRSALEPRVAERLGLLQARGS